MNQRLRQGVTPLEQVKNLSEQEYPPTIGQKFIHDCAYLGNVETKETAFGDIPEFALLGQWLDKLKQAKKETITVVLREIKASILFHLSLEHPQTHESYRVKVISDSRGAHGDLGIFDQGPNKPIWGRATYLNHETKEAVIFVDPDNQEIDKELDSLLELQHKLKSVMLDLYGRREGKNSRLFVDCLLLADLAWIDQLAQLRVMRATDTYQKLVFETWSRSDFYSEYNSSERTPWQEQTTLIGHKFNTRMQKKRFMPSHVNLSEFYVQVPQEVKWKWKWFIQGLLKRQ